MSVTFLTPLGALLVLVVVVPLVALRSGEARARGVARSLGLPDGGPSRAALAAVAVLAALLGLAASQPLLTFESDKRVRTDAEVYVVLDTTRSMRAAASLEAPTRFARARAAALRLRAGLDDVPVGLASFTDRVLPHLFPSTDSEAYAVTLERSVRIEQPPPERDWDERATGFGALAALVTRNFYASSATSRVFVLVTDGETREYSLPMLAGLLRRPPATVPVLLHVRRDGEELYLDGELDRGYESDPASGRALAELASATGGSVHSEDDMEGLVRATRAALGDGDRAADTRERRAIRLAPWLALAAALPLAFLVVRRSL